MLVLAPRHVVSVVKVSPVNSGWEVVGLNHVPGVEGVLDGSVSPSGFCGAATSVLGGSQEFFNFFLFSWRVFGLWEWIDSLVVVRVVLLSLGGDMLLHVGPGVNWGGPSAVRLNGDVVGASADAEETFFSPVMSPGVSDGPVFLTILNTVSNDGDIVDDLHVASGIAEDSTSVVLEGLWHGDTASKGSSLVELVHHVLLSSD